MSHSDPIADMLTRLRNASAVKKAEVVLPYSKVKEAIARILKDESFVNDFTVIPAEKAIKYQQLKIILKYQNGIPAIRHIKRVSKPGQRIYADKERLPIVLNNLGIALVSTSRGLMTNKKAKKEGLGGEIICEVD